MARLYADEQYPYPVVEFLRALGHDVLTVQEAVEDYCLNKAMDEAVNTPLLTRSEALAYLQE